MTLLPVWIQIALLSVRFEQQFELMEKENLDLLGGHIAGFIDQPDEIVSYRRVPIKHEDIVALPTYEKCFNHMAGMFKRKMVLRLAASRRRSLYGRRLLWLNMISAGARTGNGSDSM